MNELRRNFLKGSTSAAMLMPWLGSGLLMPTSVLAADWNKTAFSARNVNDALKAYGSANASETRDIVIAAPEIAENGAKVEVEITSNLANTRSLAIFADKNPMPMCSAIEFFWPGAALPARPAQALGKHSHSRDRQNRRWQIARCLSRN